MARVVSPGASKGWVVARVVSPGASKGWVVARVVSPEASKGCSILKSILISVLDTELSIKNVNLN